MKATALLEKQHRKVEALFKKIHAVKGDPMSLVRELADDLAAHMAIEQNTFYPAVKYVKEDLVLESFEEHALAELALKRLLATDPSSPSFEARVTALEELISHHVKEEEDELFPKVEKAIEAADLEALGKRMKKDFDDAVETGWEALLPRSYSQTTADAANRHTHPIANGHGTKRKVAHA